MNDTQTPHDTLHHLLGSRYSCRAFRRDLVPAATLDAILSLAQKTASWSNVQPWKIWLTEGAETDKLRDALYAQAAAGAPSQPDLDWPTEYTGIYRDRRRDTGFKLYGALGIGRDDAAGRKRQTLENFRFFGAPHFALVTSPRALGTYGVLDCGGWVSNFMLAARAHNVDSIAQAAIGHHSPFMRQWFGVPDDRAVVCGISFGYADEAHPVNAYRVARAPVADAVVRHESTR